MEEWEVKMCLRLSYEKHFQELVDAYEKILEPYISLLKSLPKEQYAVIKCYQQIVEQMEGYQTRMAYQIGIEDGTCKSHIQKTNALM